MKRAETHRASSAHGDVKGDAELGPFMGTTRAVKMARVMHLSPEEEESL
jgi:hypothetical protein